MPRFDSLLHVTRSGTWINQRDDASLGRLLRELDRGGIERGCLVGLSGVVDNEYLLECTNAAAGRLVPIAGFDPGAATDATAARQAVTQYLEAGFAGVKLHPRLHRYDPLDERCIAAIQGARDAGLVVFIDTLFRQRGRPTLSAADVIDRLVHDSTGVRMVLLHGGGPALLAMAELVRLHPTLLLDVSYTLLAYAGSSLDQDLRWVFQRLDQRVVIGSDMPEFTPSEAFERAEALAVGLSPEKWANISYRNLSRWFE